MQDMCKLPPQWISPGAAVKGSRSRQRIEGGALLMLRETLGGVLGGVTARLPNGSKFGCLPSRHMAVIDCTISDNTEPSFLRMRAINRTLLAIQR